MKMVTRKNRKKSKKNNRYLVTVTRGMTVAKSGLLVKLQACEPV